jgi:hypothetical protein
LLNQATLAATNGASMAGAPAMFGAPEGLLQLGKLFTP